VEGDWIEPSKDRSKCTTWSKMWSG